MADIAYGFFRALEERLLMCQAVHTSPRAIEKLVSTDATGDVRGFDWGPSDKGIEYVLTSAAQALHIGLVSVSGLFDLLEMMKPKLIELDSTWRSLVSPPN